MASQTSNGNSHSSPGPQSAYVFLLAISTDNPNRYQGATKDAHFRHPVTWEHGSGTPVTATYSKLCLFGVTVSKRLQGFCMAFIISELHIALSILTPTLEPDLRQVSTNTSSTSQLKVQRASYGLFNSLRSLYLPSNVGSLDKQKSTILTDPALQPPDTD
ncbi:hypothetical protein BDZ45DRAFT_737354 [Acephala macrosclerotiorum]|nr:hypothetical protein BDZ45DRAFT_737354 [Acephala macrosclerotiorum]